MSVPVWQSVQTLSPFLQQAYIQAHVTILLVSCAFGFLTIRTGLKLRTDTDRKRLRIALAWFILLSRLIRYPIDAVLGAFHWDDLLSLHVCHINLILLVICLIRPHRFLFNYCFLIGIPMGLASGLFPGDIPLDAPSPILRGVLFVFTHLLMVIGALYLAIVEQMKPTWRHLGILCGVGAVQSLITYGVNRLLGTNFLYIMTPVAGTPIESLSDWLGWPGYAIAMVLITYGLMLLTMLAFQAAERVNFAQKS